MQLQVQTENTQLGDVIDSKKMMANRRFFHGPGFNNTDFGFSKRTLIKESMRVDLSECFHTFNHTQFTNPHRNIGK